MLNGAVYKLSYDLLNDLEPIALLASNDCVIVSRNELPASNLKQLITWVKTNPERFGRHRRSWHGDPTSQASCFKT